MAANIAGGTHHAYADRGGGFCVFNDAAVAARLMQAEHGRDRARRPLKVAIVDLDVHQGNGTARIFRDDPSVFTLSLHGQKNFPFRKEASDLDVDLPDGCGDDDYLHALERALDELEQRFEPGLVIYLAGADPHEGDRLGRLKLTWDGLEARDRRVFDWAWQRRMPLAFAMAGGYGARIEDTVQAQVNTFKVATEYAQRWQNAGAMSNAVTRQARSPHAAPSYRAFRTIGTRWMDNDAYGHVNNVVYYSWFDTVVNAHLIEQGALDIHHGEVIGLVIETQCNYFAPIEFPQIGGSGPARRPHRPFERALRGGAVRPRRAADGREGAFRPCVRGPRNTAAGGVARQAQIGAGGLE